MRNTLTILCVILFIGCEKNDDTTTNDLQYDFKITRSYTSNNGLDSTIYYYSGDNKLVGYYDYLLGDMHKYVATYEPGRTLINCKSESILLSDKQYYIDNEKRIDSIYLQGLSGMFVLHNRFTYEGDRIVSCERRNSIPELKSFYKYNQDIRVQDSIVTIPYNDHYKIVTYTYTDTIKPDFMIDECGLYEYPLQSDYLIRETKTLDYYEGGMNTIHEKFSYTIGDDRVEVQISENGVHKATAIYLLEEKE